MNEMTLEGLLRLGNSQYTKIYGKYLVIEVSVEGNSPEIIINPKENFEAKFAYYEKAYNDDLTLKANPNIKIVRYDVVEDLNEYFN